MGQQEPELVQTGRKPCGEPAPPPKWMPGKGGAGGREEGNKGVRLGTGTGAFSALPLWSIFYPLAQWILNLLPQGCQKS